MKAKSNGTKSEAFPDPDARVISVAREAKKKSPGESTDYYVDAIQSECRYVHGLQVDRVVAIAALAKAQGGLAS